MTLLSRRNQRVSDKLLNTNNNNNNYSNSVGTYVKGRIIIVVNIPKIL